MQTIIETKENTQKTINRIIAEKEQDISIVVVTDSDYAIANGYQNLTRDVDMTENNIIILKP